MESEAEIDTQINEWIVKYNVYNIREYEKAILKLLFTKGMFNDKPVDIRDSIYLGILEPSKAGVYEEEYFMAKQRLHALLYKDPEEYISLPKTIQSFWDFCKLVPEWDDPEQSFVCFRDVPGTMLIQRTSNNQSDGLSYLMAPIVMQHYLVGGPKIINPEKYILEHTPLLDLEEYIMKPHRGGDSMAVLKDILTPNSAIIGSDDVYEGELPGLVPYFCPRKDFYTLGKYVYHGKPQEEESELDESKCHAMVLVGIRDNNTKYLLQNWWNTKQFIEVDREYLGACGSGFPIVTATAQEAIPDKFVTCETFFADFMNDQFDRPVYL